METVQSRYVTANRMSKTLSVGKTSSKVMTRTIADGLTAGMHPEDIAAIVSQLQIQAHQLSRSEAEMLAAETMNTVRTMARLGVDSTEVADALCQARRNRFTSLEMVQLRQQMVDESYQHSARQIANRHAGAIGRGGHGGAAGGSKGGIGGSGGGSDGGSGGSGK
jgi:uncharacterized membrane protein YgcG